MVHRMTKSKAYPIYMDKSTKLINRSTSTFDTPASDDVVTYFYDLMEKKQTGNDIQISVAVNPEDYICFGLYPD